MTEAGVTRTSDSRTTRATRRDIGDSSFIGGDGTSREMNRRAYATAKAKRPKVPHGVTSANSIHRLSGDESLAWTLWEAMLAHAGALHLTVSTSDSDPLARPHSYGYYLHDAAAVWVRPDRARADMAATLAHELAHAVTHNACAGMTQDVREVVAESVAYAVCSRFGLDLSLRSVDYVAGWLDDPEAFHLGMAAIHDGAASLIDATEAAMTDAGLEL